VVFEPPGGGNDNIDGYAVFPGYNQGQLDFDDLVFRDKLVFGVVAFDKNVGQTDGAGIDNVSFRIIGDQGTVTSAPRGLPVTVFLAAANLIARCGTLLNTTTNGRSHFNTN
jgi:hypothetical protein